MKGYNFAYLDEQTKRMIRRALLKAVAIPGHQVPFGSREMPLPYGWGTGGIQVTASVLGADDVLKVIDQGADDTTNAVSIRRFFARTAGVRTTTQTADATLIQTRHRIPEKTLREDQIIVYQVPQPEPLYRLEPSRVETRRMHGLADYGLMHVKLYEDISRFGQISISYDYPVMVNHRHLMSPSPIPAFDNPKMHKMPALQLFGAGREKRIYAIPPWTDVRSLDFDDHPFRAIRAPHPCGLCGATDSYLDEVVIDDSGGRLFVCSDTDHCARAPHRGPCRHRGPAGGSGMSDATLLSARGLSLSFGAIRALAEVDVDLWPGEMLAVVGESGSGKTTLLNVLSGRLAPDAGAVWYRDPSGKLHDVHAMPAPALRTLHRSDWGFVHQDPRQNLRMNVTAGGNVGERLMAQGARHYGNIRAQAIDWLTQVEIDADRVDDMPRTFSGGMLQRLQIARTLVTHPSLVFMDEPTGSLDVSVQARLLDLIRTLVSRLKIAVVLVTHDIGVARLLAHRIMVMQRGRVVETGLTDQVLDDPQHPYTQLLVSSVLQA